MSRGHATVEGNIEFASWSSVRHKLCYDTSGFGFRPLAGETKSTVVSVSYGRFCESSWENPPPPAPVPHTANWVNSGGWLCTLGGTGERRRRSETTSGCLSIGGCNACPQHGIRCRYMHVITAALKQLRHHA